jgi:phage gp46-like protein
MYANKAPRLIGRSRNVIAMVAALVATFILLPRAAQAQPVPEHIGEMVPRDVREMYDRGLQYLTKTQAEDGSWPGGQSGPGVTGMALMAFLASGEDPNFGVYSNQVKKATRSIIRSQDASTGYFGNSMYHHGFAMLGLAEAYGAVDDRNLWSAGDKTNSRSIGAALELAVRAAITSQKKNSYGGWRYSPNSNDADTSVSGAVMVGLLAARNAGIEVPDESIDRAVSFYQSLTSNSGQVAYTTGMGGFDDSTARISIGSLVYAVARRKDLPQYKATVEHLKQRLEAPPNSYREYTLYYQAQALFQGDVEVWEKWNKILVRQLKQQQNPDGSFNGDYGPQLGTPMSLLSLALNYRFLPIYER